MALEYLAGDFGEPVSLHNENDIYPSCAGVACSLGVSITIFYFNEKHQNVDTAPGAITKMFQKLGQMTQQDRYKTLIASINDEIESLTLLSQELFDNKAESALLSAAGFLTLGPLGLLAGKAAGKKGEAVFAIKFSDTASEELVRGKKLVVHATAKEYEVLAKASASSRLKNVATEFIAKAEQPPAIDANDSISDLEKLVSMKEKGFLNDEEFTAAKAKLLGL